jgi:hypothetical protein
VQLRPIFCGLLVANKAPRRIAEGHFFTSPLPPAKASKFVIHVVIVQVFTTPSDAMPG